MLHGIEELSKDGQGYVYWKGVHVEHYSFGYSDEGLAREKAAAEDLAHHCAHLESLSIPVNGSTAVWCRSWYDGLNRQTLDSLPPLIRSWFEHPPNLFESKDDSRVAWITDIHNTPEDPDQLIASVKLYDNGRYHSSFLLHSDDLGGFYHPMIRLGWRIPNMGQTKDCGICYATTNQLMAWLRAKKFIQ